MTTDDRQLTKTDTINKRSIRIYLPSDEIKDEWTVIAEKKGLSLSRFINLHVANGINREKEDNVETKINLIKQNQRLETENKEMQKRIKMLENLNERLEKEVRSQTIEPFLQKDFIGIRKFEEDIIRLFKSCIEIRKEDIYKRLDIDINNIEETTAIKKQIEILEKYELIKDHGEKWRWNGNPKKN